MAFAKGQEIRVSYLATIDRVNEIGGINFTDPGGVYIHLQPRQIDPDLYTVEVIPPENWPPKIGDIWAAEGTEYFIRDTPNNYPYGVWCVPANRDPGIPANELEALNPVLVRRRGQ